MINLIMLELVVLFSFETSLHDCISLKKWES